MPSELTQNELDLIRNFTDVQVIPEGVSHLNGITSRTRHGRILFERHEKVRVIYRSLIGHGFTKWEIADMMRVTLPAVRQMANKLGLIWELKGLGRELPDAANVLHIHDTPTITRE